MEDGVANMPAQKNVRSGNVKLEDKVASAPFYNQLSNPIIAAVKGKRRSTVQYRYEEYNSTGVKNTIIQV